MNENAKVQIDAMDYEDMLRLWRNAPVGHPMFQGETGDYYQKVMRQKQSEVGQDAHVRASKAIGWEGK